MANGTDAGAKLPGAAGAAELTRRLQQVARALALRPDRAALRAEAGRVMAVAEKLGLTRLYLMAEELRDRASGDADCTLALAALRDLLHPLILALQAEANRGLIRS